ncbi:MAG TPA: prephenate dehydrogenase/arogenate dehydrogenase family protein [Spirochaetia bacterium]|nr:prephenate dehydrogenase/arogenate dehydrogenase family protein [Spirochaetia bacterium]
MVVGVYGLGRFGAFWATLLARRFTVIGHNRTPRGTVPDGVTLVGLDQLAEAETIFLCTAISATEAVLNELSPLLKSGTTVIDTCSVKMYPVELMKRILPESVHILGSHPMFGPDSAGNGIRGLPIILSPVRAPDSVNLYWENQFRDMQLTVHTMTPEAHDREAAYTQGITHFIGRVLKDLELKPSAIGTLGYRKLLEVMEQTCNDPWQLFVDLQRFNPYTGEMRSQLRGAVDRIVEHFSDPARG